MTPEGKPARADTVHPAGAETEPGEPWITTQRIRLSLPGTPALVWLDAPSIIPPGGSVDFALTDDFVMIVLMYAERRARGGNPVPTLITKLRPGSEEPW